MSDNEVDIVAGKTFTQQALDYLNSDDPENLKRQLKDARIMIMAMMDSLGLEKVNVTRQSLMLADGGLETYYDFETDGYVIGRTK